VRPVPLRVRGAVACALTVAVAALLVGCGSDEYLARDAPDVSGADAKTCAALLDDLPDRVADQDRRTVSPADAPVAAWGGRAITLSCGVDVPAEFNKFSGCVQANGVGWFVPDEQQADQSLDVTATTVGYRPVVQLQVPASYRPEGVAAALAEMAAAVKKELELVKPCV